MTKREASIKKFKEFGMICNDYEFTRAENLSRDEQKNIGMTEGLVVIEKSLNPGMTIEPIKSGDFVGFLIEKMFKSGVAKEAFEKPFSKF